MPWTAALQAPLSSTVSWSLVKFMSTESVMLSNHLILCHPLLLLPSIFPSIRIFSSELVLHLRWPKYWSFSFSISLSNEYSGLISLRIDWFDLLAVQGTLKSLLQHHSSKASIVLVAFVNHFFERMYLTVARQGLHRTTWSPCLCSLGNYTIYDVCHVCRRASGSWELTWGQTGGGNENNGHLLQKVPCTHFSNNHVRMWELDHKESWTLKNWCFWIVVLEKTLESPLDCKAIKPVNSKWNWSWIFTRRTDTKAEAPILWPPDVKSWLIGKDPDAGKDGRQMEKMAVENEMVR